MADEGPARPALPPGRAWSELLRGSAHRDVRLEETAHESLFIPMFFVDTGFLINPAVFVQDTISNFPLVASIIIALLVGKGVAARFSGRSFGYTTDERLTVWALTLPQVAAPLAAALVAHDTLSHDGHRLLAACRSEVSVIDCRSFVPIACIWSVCGLSDGQNSVAG